MRKWYDRKAFYLAVVLLCYQLLVPISSIFAAENSSMLPPSNIAVQQVTPDDVKLTWNSVYGATGYNVYEIKEGQIILLGKATTASYNVNNLDEGSYQYVISTLNAEGESGPSAPVSVDITYPDMSAPVSITKTIKNGNDIVLNWDASQYAEKYNLYQITGENEKTLVTSVSARTYTVSDAPEGNYTYSVSAINSLYGESPLSNSVDVEVIYPVIKAPSNFTYTVMNGNDITLKWDSVPYATDYMVYQVIDGEKVLKSTATSNSVKFTNVSAGDYTYEIRSNSDRFGESAEGSQLSVTVGPVTMAAPDNFTYKLQNINDIVLTWGSVPYSTSYKVYQIIDGEKVLKSTVTGTSVTYSNMPSGDYVYEVHSYSDRFGESAEGSKVSLNVEAVTMAAPGNFAYKLQNGNDINLSWDNTSNATSYKIYQIVNGEKVLKSTVTGTTATYTNMPEGDYNFEVHSYSTRFGESEEGSKLSIKLIHPTMEQPGNLTKTIKNASDFTLSWDASSYATNYKVYQIVDGEKVLKSTVSGTSVTYSKMVPGEYTFVVYAYSSRFGESANGNQLTFTLTGQMMEAPTNLTYSIANGNDITLKWSDVRNANGYNIYQVIDGEQVLQRTVSGTSVTFSNLPAGDYNYEVHSYSTLYGESTENADQTIPLVHPTMEAPADLTYKVQNGNDIALSWGAVQYANSYKVYEIVNDEKVLVKTVTSVSTTLSNVSEGQHTYVVQSLSSRFGESAKGSDVALTLVHPTMEAPGNLTYTIPNGNDIALKWNTAPYATGYKVYQIIDGQPVLERTVTGTSTTFTNMPEGNYTYEVHSVSSRFGESSEGSKTALTLVHPIMQAPANLTQRIVNGNDIVLRWNAATYATSYKVYKIVDGEQVLERTVSGTSTTFTNMPEGKYEYVIHSYSNRFDESPIGSSIDFTLTWPIVQPPLLTGNVFNANNMTLSWPAVTWANEYRVYKVTDDERELIYKGTTRSYNIYNLTEETHSFEVTAYSTRFGESKASNRVTETIVYPVMQKPTANLKLLSETSARISWDFITYANGYNIYEIIDGKLVLIAEKVNNLSYILNDLTYANHEYVVTSYSNSFGESDPSNTVLAKLIIDTEAPVTTANSPTDWTNQDQVVTLTATDNETGVAKTFYSVDDSDYLEGTSFEVKGEGVHKVSYYSIDKVGNKEVAKTIEVKIDKTAPETTSNAPDTWSKEDVTIDLSAKDEQSGPGTTYYSINDSVYVEGTFFVIENEGVHKVSYYSIDKAGNKEAAQTIEVNIDKTAPKTTSDAPDTWSKEDVTVNLSAKDEHSGPATTYYSINDSEYVEGSSFVIGDEGVHKVSYYSIDKAGNKEAAQTIEVKIDKTVPVTTSDAPDTWSKEDVSVNLSAKDEQSGLGTTYYSIDDSEYEEGASFEIVDEGVHKVSYYSIDKAGNKEEAQTIEVKIDKTAPVTTSDAPDSWSKEDVTVNLSATDEQSGPGTTYYSINDFEYVEGTSFVIGKEGVHKVSYYSIDKAGNKEEAQTIEVKVDKTAPEVSMNLDAEYELGSNLKLQYLAEDNLSNVVTEEMIVTGPNESSGKEIDNGTALTLDKPGTYNVTVIATNSAGLTTEIQKQFVVYIPATIEVTPKVIKGNKGVFTVRVDLPESFSSNGFDQDTATVNGVHALTSNKGYYNQAKNGQFKFERSDFTWTTSEKTLTYRGYLDGYLVVGQTTVKVQK